MVDGAEMALEEVTLDLVLWLEFSPIVLYEVLTSDISEYDLIWNRVLVEVLVKL